MTLEGLSAFFRQVPLAAGDRLVVAFSGGGDSTALLWSLSRLAPAFGSEAEATIRSGGVHRASGPAEILDKEADLSGEDVLPAFRCRIADLFPPLASEEPAP